MRSLACTEAICCRQATFCADLSLTSQAASCGAISRMSWRGTNLDVKYGQPADSGGSPASECQPGTILRPLPEMKTGTGFSISWKMGPFLSPKRTSGTHLSVRNTPDWRVHLNFQILAVGDQPAHFAQTVMDGVGFSLVGGRGVTASSGQTVPSTSSIAEAVSMTLRKARMRLSASTSPKLLTSPGASRSAWFQGAATARLPLLSMWL